MEIQYNLLLGINSVLSLATQKMQISSELQKIMFIFFNPPPPNSQKKTIYQISNPKNNPSTHVESFSSASPPPPLSPLPGLCFRRISSIAGRKALLKWPAAMLQLSKQFYIGSTEGRPAPLQEK